LSKLATICPAPPANEPLTAPSPIEPQMLLAAGSSDGTAQPTAPATAPLAAPTPTERQNPVASTAATYLHKH